MQSRVTRTGRTVALCALLLAFVMPHLAAHATQLDPLPSWNEGSTKRTLTAFVEGSAKRGSASFVLPEHRIAIFDDDGTLWSEKLALLELAFALDHIARLAFAHPEWRAREPFASALERNLRVLSAAGDGARTTLLGAVRDSMSADEFSSAIEHWVATAKHPRSRRPYRELAYQPMLELIHFLHAHGWKTYVVTDGGGELVRTFMRQTYGIPAERVLGATGKARLVVRGGKPVLLELSSVSVTENAQGESVARTRYVGQVPALIFGTQKSEPKLRAWSSIDTGVRFLGLLRTPTGASSPPSGRTRGLTHVDPRKEWNVLHARQAPSRAQPRGRAPRR